ncbi:MAG: hypothetical protein SV186_03745, partial [Candidatus Nanohaloarchaea archaeon]|nr:hypothetical protein [Candidatus Nanohaloarchaea archaeon]
SSVSSDLQSVLGAGNSAGSYNINMSGQDIYNVNEVFIEPSGDSIFFQPGGGASQYTLRFDDKDLRFWNNDATTVLRLNDNTGTIDIPNGNLDMNGNNIRNVGNINADGGLLAGGTGQSIGIGTNEVGRDPIGNLSDWQTSWVLADGGLGGYPRNLYFQDNQGNVVMRFDANGGINMYGNSINDVNTIKTYRVVTGKGNSNGNGVTISDDGGFYDDNDGWVTFDDRAGGNNANGLSIEQGSLRITSGNLTMNGNDIENRGNYWWGQVSLDTGTFRTSGGVTGDVGSFPASGNTNCGTGGTGSNVTCIHNYGSSKYRIEFDVPNRMDDDWWSGDGTPGGMCWGISAGDNEVNDEGWNSGVRSVITDGNGHCMGPGVDDCAAADIYDVQRTSHDVYGVVCFDPH